MRGVVIDEPELEFGSGGRHIDPRHGIMHWGPVDVGTDSAPSVIRVGIIGPEAAVEGIRSWLYRAREPIEAKPPRYPGQAKLFPAFPGFGADHTFHSVTTVEERNLRTIPLSVIRDIPADPVAAVEAMIDAYMSEINWLAEASSCNLIICARPAEMDIPRSTAESSTPRLPRRGPRPIKPDFHDQLKAAALGIAPPLQIIRPETWDDDYRPPEGGISRRVQDPATRAWNLHTALYLKAGGAPWRLVRSFSDLATCYLGVSFYHSTDNSQVQTSTAQMFNERGEGVVIRGGPAALKHDNRPYLPEDDAHTLIATAMKAFRKEHGHFPARLVVHKTSSFVDSEIAGFQSAAADLHIDRLELVWVHEGDLVRLFRPGTHPPLRGTLLTVDGRRTVLYTRGSIDFYETYPGMYVPDPITIRPVDTAHRPQDLAEEMLALTKLNWNHSQLDGRLPITLRASRKVGNILRHLPPDDVTVRRYHYYM